MRTIRVEKLIFKVKEHEAVTKITVHMPSTGAISGSQTLDIFTTEEIIPNLNTAGKFFAVETFQGEMVTLNQDYVILAEVGKLVGVDEKLFFFLSKNEEYEVITQGSYGYTRPCFSK